MEEMARQGKISEKQYRLIHTVALIALTGNGEITDAVDMLKKITADYLEKPISSQRLQEAIARA